MSLIALPTNFLLSLTREEVDTIRSALLDYDGLWPDVVFEPSTVDRKRQARSIELRSQLLELMESALMDEYYEEQERFSRNLVSNLSREGA